MNEHLHKELVEQKPEHSAAQVNVVDEKGNDKKEKQDEEKEKEEMEKAPEAVAPTVQDGGTSNAQQDTPGAERND